MTPTLLIHDAVNFPMVRTRHNRSDPDYGTHWCSDMDRLTGLDQRFVLIEIETGEEESHTARKQRGAWMKFNKTALADRCLLRLIVQPDAEKRAAIEAMLPGVIRAFGVHQAVCASLAEAETMARQVLAGETVGRDPG